MKLDKKLEISLLIIRISIGMFFLVWAVEKIIDTNSVQKVFSTFYYLNISAAISIGLGIVQALIVLLFMAGLFRMWTYGLVLGMHLVSTLASYKQLLSPYEESNPLFWAAIPTLGALIALFLLRKEDNLFVLSKAKTKKQTS